METDDVEAGSPFTPQSDKGDDSDGDNGDDNENANKNAGAGADEDMESLPGSEDVPVFHKDGRPFEPLNDSDEEMVDIPACEKEAGEKTWDQHSEQGGDEGEGKDEEGGKGDKGGKRGDSGAQQAGE